MIETANRKKQYDKKPHQLENLMEQSKAISEVVTQRAIQALMGQAKYDPSEGPADMTSNYSALSHRDVPLPVKPRPIFLQTPLQNQTTPARAPGLNGMTNVKHLRN